MGLIHLPFLRGQDESVDAKIAPLGVLKSAKNVRFDRQGRVIKRPGFDVHPVASQASGASIADPTYAAPDRPDKQTPLTRRPVPPVSIWRHDEHTSAENSLTWINSRLSAPIRQILAHRLPHGAAGSQ